MPAHLIGGSTGAHGAIQTELAEQRTQAERLVILGAALSAARWAGRLGGQERCRLLLHDSPLDLAEELLPLGEGSGRAAPAAHAASSGPADPRRSRSHPRRHSRAGP